MLYIYRLALPANTQESSKERLDFELPRGVINRVEVAFPPGPMGLAHLQIFHEEHQLFPTIPEESFAWNDINIAWAEEYELEEPWNDLSLRGWNLDDSYEHTISVRFSVSSGRWGLLMLSDLQTQRIPPEEW